MALSSKITVALLAMTFVVIAGAAPSTMRSTSKCGNSDTNLKDSLDRFVAFSNQTTQSVEKVNTENVQLDVTSEALETAKKSDETVKETGVLKENVAKDATPDSAWMRAKRHFTSGWVFTAKNWRKG